MSESGKDKPNPFLKPTSTQASLFGGSLTTSSNSSSAPPTINTNNLFGSSASLGSSSLFGGAQSAAARPAPPTAVPVVSSAVAAATISSSSRNIFGESTTAAVGLAPRSVPAATAPTTSAAPARPSLFGAIGLSGTATPTNSSISSTSAPSLFGGSASLVSTVPPKHSLFVGITKNETETSSDASRFNRDGSVQNIFGAAESSGNKNIHSLFGSTEPNSSGSLSEFGTCDNRQQEANVSSSLQLPWETKKSSISSNASSTSLFGGTEAAIKDAFKAPSTASSTSSLFGGPASSSVPPKLLTKDGHLSHKTAAEHSSQYATSSRSSTVSYTGGSSVKEVPTIVSLFGGNVSSSNKSSFPDIKPSSKNIFGGSHSRSDAVPRPSSTGSATANEYSFKSKNHASTSIESSNLPKNDHNSKSTSFQSGMHQNIFGSGPSVQVKPVTRPITSYDDIFDLSCESPIPGNSKNEDKKSPSTMEKPEPTAIIATNIPDNYLDKSILKNHFSKFGTVLRVTLNMKANQAQVNFVTHESAALAKKQGKKLHPNIPEMMIFFGTAVRAKPEDSQADRITQKKNNAVKILRQSSSDSLDKFKKTVRKPSIKESSKLPRFLSDSKEKVDRSGIPSGLSKISKFKRDSKSTVPATTAIAKDSSQSATVVSAKDFAALAQVKAATNQEKYDLLNVRDKLMRKQQTKEVDVKKAKYLSATCPDMCPEKERYMREVQFDLSPYEMVGDRKVDHRMAVKKFSRSSADKDEPLPHELRPGPVLEMTMNHLLCNILPEMEDDSNTDMDLCYNFLWDRTRAMRSDIMQQHLQNSSAIYVLERCVRFHIFSSERLCTEPPDVFDPKMNNEHLSKSLHSLKELYTDLSQTGVYFETEAEFRAYDILLNVNDGNIMFAYLLFQESVRTSPEVQFAIKVLHALQSNHYVRFFRLVKEATFLQACIMHRYFNQVRARALNIMVKAFHAPSKSQSVSLNKLVRLLLFENNDEASLMLATHGLVVGATGRVVMDRNSFIPHPEEPVAPCRAYNVISQKKESSVAAAINGGTLPANPLNIHKVHNSFTAAGYLDSKAIKARDQERSLNDTTAVPIVSILMPAISKMPVQPLPEITIADQELDFDEPQPVEASAHAVATLSAEDNFEQDDEEYEEYATPGYGEDETGQSVENETGEFGENAAAEYDKETEQYDEKETEEYNNEGGEYGEDYSVQEDGNFEEGYEDCDLEDSVQQSQSSAEVKTTKKYSDDWKFEIENDVALCDAVLDIKHKAKQEMVEKLRTQAALKSRADSLIDLVNFKIREKYFSAWRKFHEKSQKLRTIRHKILSRRAFSKWRSFAAAQKLRWLVKEKMLTRNVMQCVSHWRWNVQISRIVRTSTARYANTLMLKYFKLWKRYIKKKKWHKKRLHEGFPACSSRLTLPEQNHLWKFDCGNIKRSFRDIQDLERDIELKRVKFEIIRNLSETICNAPLPIRASFQRFINSKNVENNLKSKFFTLVICFDEFLIGGFVHNWLRMKLNPSQKLEPVQINCSYTIESPVTVGSHVIQIIEASRDFIPRIKGVSSILYVIENAKNAGSALEIPRNENQPNSKTFILNKKGCYTAETSSSLMNVMLELYKTCKPPSKLQPCTLSQLVSSFVSRHVLDVASETERMGKELCYAPLPPAAYTDLYDRALEQLRAALTSERLAGVQWHTPRSTPQAPVVRRLDNQLVTKIQSALRACRLKPCLVRPDWNTWSVALEGVLCYVKQSVAMDGSDETDADPPQYGLLADITWHIDLAKQNMIQRKVISSEEDELQHPLLLPWKNIYSAMIAFKLSKVPPLDVIYCEKDLNDYVSSNEWFVPHLLPLSAVPALLPNYKRKALQAEFKRQSKESHKKVKIESKLLSHLAEEKKKSAAFEARLHSLLDESDNVLVDLFNEDPKIEDGIDADSEDLYDMSQPTLRTQIAKEKQNLLAFETRLRAMIQ